MSVLRRALLRATCAGIVAGCLVVACVGFTQPALFFAVCR